MNLPYFLIIIYIMSTNPESYNNVQPNNSSDNDYDDEDDFVTFQYESKEIGLYYTHLSKYSRLIRKEYLYSDIKTRLPQELHYLQEQFHIDTANIFYFFKLLQQNYVIGEKLSFKQYTDLFKISEFLQAKKIIKKLTDYFDIQKVDIDFLIQIILNEIENSKDKENYQFQISKQMEEVLSEKVNECLQNSQFSQLPLHCLHRIVRECDMKKLSMDLLYDFIKADMSKFNILFSFMDLKKLSDDRIGDLYECFSNNSNKPFFSYLKCNLDYIMELRESNRSIQSKLSQSKDSLQNEISELNGKISSLESEKSLVMKKLDKSEKEKRLIECENEQLKIKMNKLEIEKNQLAEEKSQMKARLDEVEKENKEMKEEIEREMCQITGVIEAKVKDGLLFNAEIKLKSKGAELNKARSKYIVSTSNSPYLGESEYEKGEQITSLNQITTLDFAGKPGTYYVRAFVVDSNGKFAELISNPVTTSGANLPFNFEGKARQIVLAKGKYKLEVWGGEGGSSVGSRELYSPGQGGKGGYSCGSVTLSKWTKIFIVVGGQGRSANSEEGSHTDGAFPDGGGASTGHCDSKFSSVPGTGGGSTSIRIATNSIYSRVIVAGGGGGADSDYRNTNNGGFGGGMTGGNGWYKGSVQSQGAGTQTGSSPGPKGSGSAGVAGTFGKGADNKYVARHNTGGGGGGGWYGGGSGGDGCGTYSTSGGGGSGWIFTESSYNSWKSRDSANSRQFQLDSSLYLANATTVAGNTSFPSPSGSGSEASHSGNGCAKITPE